MILPITKIYRFDKNKKINYIIDFTNKHYYIEDNGNLYWRNQLLANIINNNGYIHNKLRDINGKEYYILRHQLVAQVFLKDSFQDGMSVDHIDNDRTNNNVANLRWATAKIQVDNQIRRKRKEIIENETYNNEQKYVGYIENQRDYFIKYEIPKFNKGHYFILDRIYEIYNILIYGYGENKIYNSYVKEYIDKFNDSKSRERFYDFIFEKVKNYKKDISMELAKKCNNNSINIQQFEELFLNKEYNKNIFKKECIERFALTKEIFKNKNTINEWLFKIGYIIRKNNNGHIIRKL